MACILFPSPIFGPVHSRRLGTSLGINLLPAEAKVCSFDCVYCECGFNKDHDAKRKLPTREEVRTALEKKLIYLQKQESYPMSLRSPETENRLLTLIFTSSLTIRLNFEIVIFPTLKSAS